MQATHEQVRTQHPRKLHPIMWAAAISVIVLSIVGVGGMASRHDAMVAGEDGADYLLFGEPGENGHSTVMVDGQELALSASGEGTGFSEVPMTRGQRLLVSGDGQRVAVVGE